MASHDCAAGLSSERLDTLRNIDIRKKSRFNIDSFLENDNNIYDILHNYGTPNNTYGKKNRIYNNNSMQYAGLKTMASGHRRVRNKKINCDTYNNDNNNDTVKSVIQCDKLEKNQMNNSKYFLSEKGHVMTPKRILAKHVSDSDIDKYFYTKYDVTDKSTGRTEILIARREGCSNVSVQNFSEFDAYATYKKRNKKKNASESLVHTPMGIMAKDYPPKYNRSSKAEAIFTYANRTNNLVIENNWMCPISETEIKNKKKLYM